MFSRFSDKVRYKFRLLQSYLNKRYGATYSASRAEVAMMAYIYPIFAVWQVGYLLRYLCIVVGYERGTAEMVGVVVLLMPPQATKYQ